MRGLAGLVFKSNGKGHETCFGNDAKILAPFFIFFVCAAKSVTAWSPGGRKMQLLGEASGRRCGVMEKAV